MSEEKIVFCKSGGCTAKLGPGMLEHVLSKIPKKKDENLLIGFDHADDAAVYRLSDDLAVVQTLDFFPPMVEDPYIFGQIAAANALSDIYAMGGTVKTALNIVCFPEKMDLNILGEILLGGNSKVTEAGGTLAGGHSIADVDVKYGLSVMGTIHPEKILANNGVREGDDDDKIRLNQRKPSKYKGLSRFGPEKNLQRINKFMKERPTFYKKLIQMKENFRFYLRCFYCITKVVILQFNSEKQDRISS